MRIAGPSVEFFLLSLRLVRFKDRIIWDKIYCPEVFEHIMTR